MNTIKLDYLSAMRVTGKDAESFLQAQFTSDITLLTDGSAGFSAYCLPNGTVMAVLLVIRREEEFQIIAAKELIEGLISRLRMFVLRADVQLEPLNQSVFGCPDNSESCYVASPDSPGYCIAQDHKHSQPGDKHQISNWRALELDAGINWLSSETSGQFIPQMIGLEKLNALSFRKGCFPGQEVIARVRYLGKLKRRPMILKLESAPGMAKGSKIDLLDAHGETHTAVVTDVQTGSEGAVVFVVARAPEGTQAVTVVLEDQTELPISSVHT